MHDEYVRLWTRPPHHPKTVPYKHHPLHPVPLQYFWKIFPYEGGIVKYPDSFWGFGPMSGSKAHSSSHCFSSIFSIFAILRSSKWPTPDSHNSLVFINETRKNISQLPLLMNNMMWKPQSLMHMFNIRYG